MYFKPPNFTLDHLHDNYIYDNKHGVLRDILGRIRGNKVNMSKVPGHIRIGINGERYALHRIIWYYVYGLWPEGEIDHINGNCLDNHLYNLREVSHVENMQNQSRAHKSNVSTKTLGVTYVKNRGKYQAQINVNNSYIWLGYHETLEKAKIAYDDAKRLYHV